MARAGRILLWWDREADQAGRPIRADVRLVGHEIWKQACQRTRALLDDHGPAAELMENTVAQVSRYLDRIGAPESSQKHALLMVAFCRRLRRYATKLNRLELVGGPANCQPAPSARVGSPRRTRVWNSQDGPKTQR